MSPIWPVAKKFFITGGRASGETKKGTMQEALIDAKIHGCNLLPVSSVLDPDAIQLSEPPVIPHSALAYCVMAEEMGAEGHSIAAGIGWCYMRNKDGTIHKAYVVEDHGAKEERAVKEVLLYSLVQMAEAEKLQIYSKEKSDEILLNRKEWLQEKLKQGKHFDGWRSPEKEYLKYLEENSAKYFKNEIRGYDKVPEDYGYCVAALVFVFEEKNGIAKPGEYKS